MEDIFYFESDIGSSPDGATIPFTGRISAVEEHGRPWLSRVHGGFIVEPEARSQYF